MKTLTRITRLLAALVVAALAFTACSADNIDSTTTPATASADQASNSAGSEPTTDEHAPSTAPDAAGSEASAAAAEPSATSIQPTLVPEPTPTPAPAPLLAEAPAIVSTTPTDGAGVTPTFSWEPVDGATRYFLIVKDETGTPYWSWSGPEPQIRMHGGGPTIAAGYTWSVSAFDGADSFVAISAELPIAP